MTPPAKPKASSRILFSQEAHNEHDAAIEGWGEAMALQLGRLCRKALELGAGETGLTCPPETKLGKDAPLR